MNKNNIILIFVMIILAFAVNADYLNLTAQTLSYWSWDSSNLGDSVKYSNATVQQGTFRFLSSGACGANYIDRNSSNGKLNLGSYPTSPSTICFWAKKNATLADDSYAFAYSDAAPTAVWSMTTHTSGVQKDCYYGGSSAAFSPCNAASTSVGTWHFYCLSYDESNTSFRRHFWIDGIDIGTDANTVPNENSSRWNLFSAPWAGGTNYYNGSIDDAMVFRGALNISQVRFIYNGTKSDGTSIGTSNCQQYPFNLPAATGGVTINSLNVTPLTGTVNSTVNCQFSVTDVLELPVNVTIEWFKNISGSITSFSSVTTYVNPSRNTSVTTILGNGSVVAYGNATTERFFCQINVTDGTNTSKGNSSLYSLQSTLNTFINKTPVDITSTNVFTTPIVNISYSILPSLGNLSNSSIKLFYKTNNTVSDCADISNGTITDCGYKNISYSQVIGTNYSFYVDDNSVYPEIDNINAEIMDNLPHSVFILSGSNNFYKDSYLNISSTTNYTFYEIMANTSGVAPLLVYYCNSSYTTGQPSGNVNCVNFGTVIASTGFNHSHINQSKHQLLPMPIINGNVGTVKVSSTSYFIPNTVGTWSIYYTPVTVRTGQTQTSSNNGNIWSNVNQTVDGHLHQFSNLTSFYWYVCSQDYIGNYNCSSVSNDMMELGGIPPSSVNFIKPVQNDIVCGITAINWTPATSSMSLIQSYNVTKNNQTTFAWIGTISTFIGAPSTNTLWDTTSPFISFEQYIIEVDAIDQAGQSSRSFSKNFTVDNQKPVISITKPFNSTYNSSNISTDIITIVSDNSSIDSCWFSLNNNSNITYDCTSSNFSNYTQGTNVLHIYANDTCGNVKESNVTFLIGTLEPSITWILPTQTNSSILFNNTPYILNVILSGNNLTNYTITIYTPNGTINSINTGSNLTNNENVTIPFIASEIGIWIMNIVLNDQLNTLNQSVLFTVKINTPTPDTVLQYGVCPSSQAGMISLFGIIAVAFILAYFSYKFKMWIPILVSGIILIFISLVAMGCFAMFGVMLFVLGLCFMLISIMFMKF